MTVWRVIRVQPSGIGADGADHRARDPVGVARADTACPAGRIGEAPGTVSKREGVQHAVVFFSSPRYRNLGEAPLALHDAKDVCIARPTRERAALILSHVAVCLPLLFTR